MSYNIIGKKKGMTRVFDEQGNLVVCTVIAVEPNVITQVKTTEKDGYVAVQLGSHRLSSSRKKNLSKPLVGHFGKKSVEPREHLSESRLEEIGDLEVGTEIGVEYFSDVTFVDAVGVTKGKGFQGVMKRHGFHGGPAAHGSGFHRHAGSTGMRSTPGRTFKNHKMPGHMGCDRKTVEGLRVVKVDAEKQVILVKGAVPGHRESVVSLRKSVKKG